MADIRSELRHPLDGLIARTLTGGEISLLWKIDRRERIDRIYVIRDGILGLEPAPFDVPGWPPGEEERETPRLNACHDRGGQFVGVFERDEIVGAAVVDAKPIGPNRDHLQLKLLYVGRDHRGRGIGDFLFDGARAIARARGANYLYVSATPTENTVDFYRRRGCVLAVAPDPELLALEPEDIHLTCALTREDEAPAE
jgi:GNAT superfamily N-acetyltransferase